MIPIAGKKAEQQEFSFTEGRKVKCYDNSGR